MQTQYVAARSSHEQVFATSESQRACRALSRCQNRALSDITRKQASSEVGISQERQDGVRTSLKSENNDRSIQCRKSLKARLRLAWLLSCPLVAAVQHRTTTMLWLIQRQFQLSQLTPVNTNNRLLKRVFGPVSVLSLPTLQARLPAQSALRGAFAC